MKKLKNNLVGRVFTRLKVISVDENRCTSKRTYYLCECECGKQSSVRSDGLVGGTTTSCGCYNREIITKHGHATLSGVGISSTYKSWYGMVRRCTDETYNVYEQYGAKGVTVCDRWLNFKNFLSDMGERPDGHTIDRVDGTKGYSPDNCRWSTYKEQTANRHNTLYVTYNDERKPLALLCREANLAYGMVFARIFKSGWSVERALTTESQRPKSYVDD